MSPKVHEFMGRLKSLFQKPRRDREMAEELAFHQDLLREKLLRQGIPESQVERDVRRTFGNPARWHERLRELWQFRTLENLLRDVAFSLRLLRKSPGFTAIALLTLALGVGANTAVFSLVNGLLLRPLPVPQADRLAVVGIVQGGPMVTSSFPAPFFRALESKHDIFEQVFAFDFKKMQVRGQTSSENVPGMLVSGSYFSALRTPPLLGRYLTPQDDQPGGSPSGPAVVLSEDFWKTWFDRAPNVVGSTLQIANTSFTVVGVMPKRFIGADPTQRPSLFVPLAEEPIVDAPTDLIKDGYHAWWLTVMGRLQPGVSLQQANAALLPISSPILHDTVPDAGWIARKEKQQFHFIAEPGSRGFTYVRSAFKSPLMALFAMCGGILLLACMNLTSLLMARAHSRERELATRLAMGATRGRLIQQLMIDSFLVSVLGTLLGLALAPAVSQSLAAMLASGAGRDVFIDTSIDLRVLGFAALAAFAASLLIGLVPALRATSGSLNEQIKDGQHAAQKPSRHLFSKSMLAAEVALALLLVVSAGLLATSLTRLYRTQVGFDPAGVENVALAMDKQPLDGDALMQFYRQFGDNLSHAPGVASVSFAAIVPLTHIVWDDSYARPGEPAQDLYANSVGPGYFRTMRIPLLEGREFQWEDTKATGLKVVLNHAAATLLFPGQNALGQTIVQDPKKPPYEVVGVVGDAKYEDLRTAAPAAAYFPITQSVEAKPSYTAVVRFSGPLAPMATAARALTARLAPQIPSPEFISMATIVDNSIGSERVMALLSVFFAACALLVTAIGLYGTLSYSTARRTSEIGIRIALGARRAGVVALVFRENAVVALAGCAAGLAAAIAASRVLSTFLYETSPRDPWILFCSVGALTAIASAASLLPAIRASLIEPITAIRCE